MHHPLYLNLPLEVFPLKKKGEDLRIVKTKTNLCNALERLLEHTDIADVCIADICTSAKINRSTFYKHFECKNDFVSYYISNIMDRIANFFRCDIFSSNSEAFHMELAIYELQKYESIIRNLLHSQRSMVPTTMVYGNMVDYFLTSFQGIPFALPGKSPNVDMWSRFYAGGIMTVILSWFHTSNEDPNQKSLILSEFLTALLSNIRVAVASQEEAVPAVQSESEPVHG